MIPRIAVVQFRIAHLDRQTNIERIEGFVKNAAEQAAQVVVFPEDCITGSIFGDETRLDTEGFARTTFQTLAKKYRIDIVTGSCMEGTPEGNFNASYYIDSTGAILGTYHKNHLYPSEYTFLKPGTLVPVFETAYGRAGIVICWDMLFPEIFQRMKDQSVQIVYCPSYWFKEVAGTLSHVNPDSEEEQIDALCIVRSLETNCALIYCNAAGIQTYSDGLNDALIGHSQIVLPVKGALQKLQHNKEAMFVTDLDIGFLEESRRIYHA